MGKDIGPVRKAKLTKEIKESRDRTKVDLLYTYSTEINGQTVEVKRYSQPRPRKADELNDRDRVSEGDLDNILELLKL